MHASCAHGEKGKPLSGKKNRRIVIKEQHLT